MVHPDQTDWERKIPLTEFAINSSISESTGFAPFKLNYGYMPQVVGGISPSNAMQPGVKQFVETALDHLAQAHDAVIHSRVKQIYHANKLRREGPKYNIGDRVYLSTNKLALPKGRARKLMPKYIGPYEVIASKLETSQYTLSLPEELKKRRIVPSFHESRLRPYHENNDVLFPNREANVYYDFGEPDDQEWLVDEIVTHQWKGKKLEFLVRWNLGDSTWEPYSECKELEALDRYLDLQGLMSNEWERLPRAGAAAKTSTRSGTRQDMRKN